MTVILVLGTSIVLQCVAAGMALRLIRVTGRWPAWVVIATAILLMALRRSISMYRWASGADVLLPDLAAECVALVTSALMVLGLAWISPLFHAIKRSEEALGQLAKTLEREVERRTLQLVKAQTAVARQRRLASVGQLAAGVAHELNNPLGAILTFASLAAERLPSDSPHRGDLDEIVRQAMRCRDIVSELLQFSSQREAQMTGASINDVVSRTLALLEKQALFHNIRVTRKWDADMPVTIMDESQMQQVFTNIILNAVDAMDKRGNLTVETGHDDAGKRVFVRITDTGRGIPPEHREAVFDPFFTTKDPGEGTGLGLAVACRIIQGHGGRTELESEVGKGTTFTVWLPICQEMADAPAKTSTVPQPENP